MRGRVGFAATAVLLMAACGGSLGDCGRAPASVAGYKRLDASITGQIFTDGKTVTAYGFIDQTASLSWTIKYATVVLSNGLAAPSEEAGHWSVTRMQGEVSWGGSPNLSCSGTLSADTGFAQMSDFLDVTSLVSMKGHFQVEATVPTDKIVESSDTNPSHAQCNTDIAVGFLTNGPDPSQPQYAAWSRIVHPVADFGPNGGSLPLSFAWSGPVPNSPPGSTVTVVDRASETLALTISG
jgi:hypothetical protein